MFWTVPLPTIRSFSLYTQQWYMSYRFCWQLASGIRMFHCPKYIALFQNKFEKLVHLYIYIVSHHSSREHMVLTKFRHLTRLLASTLTSFHVLPWCLISSKIVLRHVVPGLPRDLVPWGFHSKAAFAMSPGGWESVWPSHPHSLCRISSSIGFCLALAHSSWFDIWTGQNIFSILRKHLLTRTWSWCMMVLVSFQVSQP